jgi:sporulation protein YlmC with PRC-barrel domain
MPVPKTGPAATLDRLNKQPRTLKGDKFMTNAQKLTLSASSLNGNSARNRKGENIGNLKDIMVDVDSGKITYGVLDFGGFLGIGNKLFAVPWSAIDVDTKNEEMIIDVDKKTLENAEGFDQNKWPDFSDRKFETRLHETYNSKPYWE